MVWARQHGIEKMNHRISLITLGVADVVRSRRFYAEGFGWVPVFEQDDIIFYQANGIVLGTWLEKHLAADMNQPALAKPGAFALAHNVLSQAEVLPLMTRLSEFGGRILKAPVAPPHGGFSGYVADPDDHAWEIAWNPAWTIDPDTGAVRFAL